MTVRFHERVLALAILLGIILLPWFYIGTGLYVALERPGLTPFVAFVFGHLLTLLVGALSWLAWDKVIRRADLDG